MIAPDAGDSSTYSTAWIDCIPKGAQLGPSLVFLGEHATRHELRGRSAENHFPRSAIQSSPCRFTSRLGAPHSAICWSGLLL